MGGERIAERERQTERERERLTEKQLLRNTNREREGGGVKERK